MIRYLLILLITSLGPIIGYFLGRIAPEELASGRKYFQLFRHGLFILILIVFMLKNPSLLFLFIVAGIIILFSFSKYREILYYYSLAFIFSISFEYYGFSVIAPMILLYGFPLGSLYLCDNNAKKRRTLKDILSLMKIYSGFIITGIILGLLNLLL